MEWNVASKFLKRELFIKSFGMCVILANKNLKEDWIITLLKMSVNLTVMKPIKSLIMRRIILG